MIEALLLNNPAPKCEIQWIDDTGKTTPDACPSVGLVYFYSFYKGAGEVLPTRDKDGNFHASPICYHHLLRASHNAVKNDTQWIFRRWADGGPEVLEGLSLAKYTELGEHLSDKQIVKLIDLCERFKVKYRHDHYLPDMSCGKLWVSGWIGGPEYAGKTIYVGVDPEGNSHS